MISRTRLFVVLLASSALVACSADSESAADDQAAPDLTADRAAIEAVGEGFLAAFNAGDSEAIGRLFSDDVVQMAPDGEVLEGRQATVDANMEFIAQFPTPPTQTTTTDEIMVFGDHAASRGTWTVRAETADGEEQVVNGKWLLILERQMDGGWLGSRWIWNQETADPAM